VLIPLSEIILTLNDPELKNEVFFLAFFLLKQIYNFIYLETLKNVTITEDLAQFTNK